FNYLSKMCLLRMREAALTMIEMAHTRGCFTIVSSSDASDHPDPYLAAGADVVIAGEGEVTLREVVDRILGGDSLTAGGGICFTDASGAVVRTPPRTILRDLDAMPSPAWDLVDVPAYKRAWTTNHGYYSMNVVTTRGCPYHCNWC